MSFEHIVNEMSKAVREWYMRDGKTQTVQKNLLRTMNLHPSIPDQIEGYHSCSS